MQLRRLRTWAMAVATVGLVMLGGAKRAAADVEVYVTAGTAQIAFDIPSSLGGSTGSFSIDGYTAQIDTVVTNYAGTASLGTVSTTVNITSTSGSGTLDTLTTTVMVVSSFTGVSGTPGTTALPGSGSLTDPLLPWSAPSGTPVIVSSGASFATNPTVTGGLATASTYFDSAPAASFAVSNPAEVSSTQNPANTTGNNSNTTVLANTGTYSLSQRVVLTGVNAGAASFNYGATSTVTNAVPEPSSVVLVGIGTLGMMGYGLRRRKALGV